MFGGILAVAYGVFTVSASKEVRPARQDSDHKSNGVGTQWRYIQPDRHIPSMNVSALSSRC